MSRRPIAQAASRNERSSRPLMYSSSSMPSAMRVSAWTWDQKAMRANMRTSQAPAIAATSMVLHPEGVITRDNAMWRAKEMGPA
jgi:hypothetical protein